MTRKITECDELLEKAQAKGQNQHLLMVMVHSGAQHLFIACKTYHVGCMEIERAMQQLAHIPGNGGWRYSGQFA